MRLTRTVHAPSNPMLNVSARQARPHSPCVRAGDYVFVSGMVPVSPETGERTQGPIADQVETVLANMQHLLESNGWSLDQIVRLNITLADLLHADDMWRVFRKFFPDNPPAATLIGMQLSFGNLVEIECTAYVGEG
ncbi:MAG: RidA family protein [Alphaproteobacteria bacterium]|nr:RidA family protein [Alphaproteobacteria bacterium]